MNGTSSVVANVRVVVALVVMVFGIEAVAVVVCATKTGLMVSVTARFDD
jgi:hypothetical protein